MSADNGIYVLQTDGPEFRVKEIQAVENLYWSRCSVHGLDTHFGNDGREMCIECRSTSTQNCTPEMALQNAREYYGEGPVFTSRSDALEYAAGILENMDVCEYGISLLQIKGKF